MENKNEKAFVLQRKSHAALLKLLNNIGVVGSILAGVADLIFVLIMVFGINIQVQLSAMIIFAVVNALIGLLINVLLRYQGQKYAEIENEELCRKFYQKRIREVKYMSMGKWTALQTLRDILLKGVTTVFSIFGLIYITVVGSHNAVQLLLTLCTLILFACFGLMAMNASYTRFYNVQVPYMELKLAERAAAEPAETPETPQETPAEPAEQQEQPAAEPTSGANESADTAPENAGAVDNLNNQSNKGVIISDDHDRR